MNDPKNVLDKHSLRHDAEAKLRNGPELSSETFEAMSSEHMQALIHDLRVHQIELEMQNEELRRTQAELDESRSRYFDLYDLAPVGYCTINEHGLIVESNLTICNLLGVTRSSLAKAPLCHFIVPEDRDAFFAHYHPLSTSRVTDSYELRLRRSDGSNVWVQIVSNSSQSVGDEIWQRIVLTDITAIKTAECALRDREQFHLSIFDSLSEHIAVLDEDGVIIAVNEAWRRFSRENGGTLKSTNPIGTNYLRMCEEAGKEPDDKHCAQFNNAMRAILAGHQSEFSYEYDSHSADQKRWFHVRVTRMLGPRAGLVVSHLDVTNRKLAELALEESRRELELVANNVPGPVARIDKNLCYRFANTHYEKFFGRSNEQVVGQRVPDVLGAELFQQAEPHIRRVLTGEQVTYVYVYRAPEDKPIYGLANLVPERDADGNVNGYLVVSIDITELKQAEEGRNEAFRILQKVTSRVPGAVYQFRLHPDGRTSMPFASQGLYSLLGVSPDKVLDDAASVFALSHPDDLSELKASIRESAQEMTPWNHEFRFLVDGKVKWIAGNAAPERESDGSVLWHGFVSDVTERVEAETARLSLESQLRESQKMEAIGTLAGGIAHDFNNALAAILANVELAQNTAAGNDLLKYFLGEIQRAGFRSRELVKQILSFCRRQPTSLRQISLGKIAQESVSMLRATLQARVTLNLTIEDDLPSVLADDTQIEQVIVNLVSNAMQAITNLSGAVEVRLDSVRADAAELAMAPSLNELRSVSSGRLVRLSVSDNGPGMVPSIRERIFEPFFTTKPQGEGTGLGLAVVHGIVKSHGGVIDVDSEPGKGTTFRIFLPAMLNSSDAPQSFKEQMLKEPSTDSLNRPAKFANAKRGQILLIEDDEAVLHSIQFLLNALGYSVSAFSDPHAGLEAFRKDPVSFQMVVTDQNMPTISGLAVVGTVRAIDPNLPVVLMSGFVDNELQTVAVKAGVSVLIAKPFTALELDEKLRPLLS